ncbi:6-hydroxymethylpterin diphosphokinase MptE-like protein [Methanococcus aeolicus]|uniref:6-hydroxymethylpterin diphosphokinase MptE-like protein n=1 Tax=Methanococcus aeolicus TaxID=42879 RepID=UPI0021C9AC9E|nr:6-hydroxymethylpterin diphosphokinase MptE-like protein [Methanococcus aeolicus]UXM85351.1 DUF115 domain-containing protein [Methanococcus aeolicus]
MNLKEWKPIYNEIMDDFGFSKENDLKSAYLLKDIIKNTGNNIELYNLENIIKNKIVYIFGAGPSLKKHIKSYKNIINSEKEKDNIIISADGATKALLEENIIPNIIVSDLDGDLTSIIESNNNGSIVVVHAHGDNVEAIKKYAPQLKNIVGSSQFPEEIENLINYGGFTDGDRCCFLAEHFNAKELILCGMDFGEYTTKYSRPNLKEDIEKADPIKIKKLQYAEKLINWLKENGNSNITFIQ